MVAKHLNNSKTKLPKSKNFSSESFRFFFFSFGGIGKLEFFIGINLLRITYFYKKNFRNISCWSGSCLTKIDCAILNISEPLLLSYLWRIHWNYSNAHFLIITFSLHPNYPPSVLCLTYPELEEKKSFSIRNVWIIQMSKYRIKVALLPYIINECQNDKRSKQFFVSIIFSCRQRYKKIFTHFQSGKFIIKFKW